jgi:competence protein ComEC
MEKEKFQKLSEAWDEYKILCFIGIVLIVAQTICAYRIFSAAVNESALYFLNVGQGDTELISHEGIRILIDAGRDVRAAVELEKIIQDRKYIDVITLTHADSDHTGGIFQILDRFSVGVLLLGDGKNENWENILSYAKQKEVPVYFFAMRDEIKYKNILFTALWPDPAYAAKDDNEKSLVLKYESPELSALFTGDLTEAGEKILERISGPALRIGILKVAHHGSKFSSTEGFLKKIAPALAIVEVGKNSYGHPAQETLGRLARIGTEVLRTDEHGTMRVYAKSGELRVERVE